MLLGDDGLRKLQKGFCFGSKTNLHFFLYKVSLRSSHSKRGSRRFQKRDFKIYISLYAHAKGGVLLNCTLWKVLCRALKLIMHRKTQGRSALVCRLLYMVWWKKVYTIAGEHDHSIFNSTGEGYHDTVSVKSRYTRHLPLLQTAIVFYHSASFH